MSADVTSPASPSSPADWLWRELQRTFREREAIILAALVWTWQWLGQLTIVPQTVIIAGIWSLHGFLLTLVLNFIISISRDWSWPIRIVVIVAAAIGLSLAQSYLDLYVGRGVAPLLGEEQRVAGIAAISTEGAVIDVTLQQNIAFYRFMFGFYAAAAVTLMIARTRTREAAEAAQQAELETLRLQLAPHFLFNALNSLSALLTTDRLADARHMVQSLSGFFRSTLLHAGSDAVRLADELETAEDYLEVERVRFGDGLDIEIDCPPDLHDAAVPGMILQPLIENAVQHAASLSSEPVLIQVVVAAAGEILTVTVSNTLPAHPEETGRQGTGTGLRNTRERLKVLYGQKASFSAESRDGKHVAVITLPLRRL